MASDPPASDPFRVRLNWPEDVVPGSPSDDAGDVGDAARDESEERDIRDEPTVAYEPGDEPDDSGSILFTVASRLEGLRAALGNVGSRLDSLIRREEQFREFTTTRLAENAEQVAMAVGSTRSAIEDQAREQQNLNAAVDSLRHDTIESIQSLRSDTVESIDGLRTSTTDAVESALAQLTDAISAMNERSDAIAEAVVAVPQILEEVEVIRAELVASIIRTETRDEELAMEVARMAEELRVLRRRLPIRSRRGGGSPEAPVDQDADFSPPPTRGRLRRHREE